MELKNALLAANADAQISPTTSDESAGESNRRRSAASYGSRQHESGGTSRMPQMCQKAASKIQSFMSQIRERNSRSKTFDDNEATPPPSLGGARMSRHE